MQELLIKISEIIDKNINLTEQLPIMSFIFESTKLNNEENTYKMIQNVSLCVYCIIASDNHYNDTCMIMPIVTTLDIVCLVRLRTVWCNVGFSGEHWNCAYYCFQPCWQVPYKPQ